MNDEWWVMNYEWWVTSDEWWVISDQWSVMSNAWWMIIDEWRMTNDEWWVMSDEWWVMSNEWWVMSDAWWTMDDEWWTIKDERWMVIERVWGLRDGQGGNRWPCLISIASAIENFIHIAKACLSAILFCLFTWWITKRLFGLVNACCMCGKKHCILWTWNLNVFVLKLWASH